MPLYTYRCRSCGEDVVQLFELGHAPVELLDMRCQCGEPFKRTYTAPGLQFRGKGWARHPEREEANRKKGPQ